MVFRLETYRLILKSKRRFFSLILIVLIGVAFMMGMLSTPYIMRNSVDRYNDEYSLHDIQIYSQYGFCLNDYINLRKNESVDKLFFSKTLDLKCKKMNGDEIVARVSEADRSVNKLKLISGRMPENDNECVVLVNMNSQSSYKYGDHLIFYNDDEDIKNYLKHDDYLVVGQVTSPEYISKVLGTSNYHNQDLDLVVYIPNVNFISDYYTTAYLIFKDSKDYISYTDDYYNFIEKAKSDIEGTAFIQQNYLKNKIITEYQDELNEKIDTFNNEKQLGEEKLADAQKELEDANVQILTYESQMQMLNQLIRRLKNTIDDNQDEINSAKEETSDFFEQYHIDINKFYDDNMKQYVEETLKESQEAYDKINGTLHYYRKQYENGLKDYQEAVLDFNDEIAKVEAQIRKAQQELEELPDAKWMIMDRDMHYSSYMYQASCKQMAAIAYVLPVLFFLVAALVCLTTMTRLIDEQRGQIGIYVALGYDKQQIRNKYVTYAFLAAISGGLLGIFIGQAIFPTVIYNTWRLMYNLPEMIMSFPILNVIICLFSFAILMMLLTAYVINKTLKETPSNLLRPKSPKKFKVIFLEKIGFIWQRLSFTSKITARNLFRYKSRFLMTITGIAGCTALLVVGWGIKDSISDIIDVQFGRIFSYDYQIYLENNHHLQENIRILEDNYANESVVAFMSYSTKVYHDEDDDVASLMVFDPRESFLVLGLRDTDRKTDIRLNNDGVIVSQKFAINNGIKKGDYITIESKNGLKASVKVSQICEMYFQHYIFISSNLYESIFQEDVYNTNIAVDTKDKDALLKDCEKLEDFVSIVDFSSMINQFQIMIEALDLIIAVIIITAGSLAFVVLINLTQVNISERIREIATLKVLGFYNVEVDQYIFKEIMILTIIGGLLGLPLGVCEHHFVMNVINMEMVMFGMNITFLSFLYSFSITLIFTIIVLFFVRKPLRKIDMVESLKSVE